MPSLIHYLDSDDARFCLRLSPKELNSPVPEKAHAPFEAITESDPLALILEASVVSDGGSKIKNVSLLIQKDAYDSSKEEAWPVNNQDIDRAWRTLFSFLTTSYRPGSVTILKEQVNDHGEFLAWQSLFYCAHRQVFFEPSCPKCGLPLQICCDDDLLLGAGHQPYSTSLRRYLFCPHCLATLGESDFYVRSLDDAGPSGLKDHRDLVRGFGQLVRNGIDHASIPCIGCAHFQECYETRDLSTTRIMPVSFYPFFMFILDATSVHMLDFLSLLSGVDINDIATQLQSNNRRERLKLLRSYQQKNSQNSLFLFDKKEQLFLEVLYLKLSLLGELAEIVLSGMDVFKYPDLGLSMDKIWVTAAEQNDMLPVLWNFRLNLMGIAPDSSQAFFPHKSPPSYALSFLGFSWFCVLLANSRQDFSSVHAEIEKVVQGLSSADDFGPELASRMHDLAISSFEKTFRRPAQKTEGASWEALWTRFLDLGLALIQTSMSDPSQFSKTEFWQGYEELRADIKKALFVPAISAVSASPIDDNKPIHEILLNIAAKWRSAVPSVPSGAEEVSADLPVGEQKIAPVTADLPEDDVIKETVILSADDFRGEPPSPRVEEDLVPETLMVEGQPAGSAETPTPAPQATGDIPETVVFAHGAPQGETPSPQEPRQEDTPETVIISPKKPSASHANSEQRPTPEAHNSKLTKQGISNTGDETPIEEMPAGAKQKGDDIPKTVIIQPNKNKGGQKDRG